MLNLIYNELYKIFHRPTIYLIFFIIFIICLINNILFKVNYNSEGIYLENTTRNLSEEINDLKIKLEHSNSLEYIETKTQLELLEIKKNYQIDSFQYNMCNNYLYDIIYNINYHKYIDNNENLVQEYQTIYNEYLKRFNNNDNISFIKDELNTINNSLNTNPNNPDLILKKEILELRINKNIDYSNTYLNIALTNYYDYKLKLNSYKPNNLQNIDKYNYNNLISEIEISKYIINNKINLNKENDLRGLLKNILEDYEIFIVIIIILISSKIVSDEFKTGTIKLLLVRPYSRLTILLSKYLTCLIIMSFSIIFLIFCELWLGGVIFGYSSLQIPIIIYNNNLKKIIKYKVITYMFLRIIYCLPKLILLLTISFSTSTIFLNSLISCLTSFCLYLFDNSIISILKKYTITKYFLTANWDFLPYLNGNVGKYFNQDINTSVIICFCYFLLLFSSLFVIFKKRDIRNI